MERGSKEFYQVDSNGNPTNNPTADIGEMSRPPSLAQWGQTNAGNVQRAQGETNYISKVAKTEKEICGLIEAGFEYVTEFEGSKIFRRRKL